MRTMLGIMVDRVDRHRRAPIVVQWFSDHDVFENDDMVQRRAGGSLLRCRRRLLPKCAAVHAEEQHGRDDAVR